MKDPRQKNIFITLETKRPITLAKEPFYSDDPVGLVQCTAVIVPVGPCVLIKRS